LLAADARPSGDGRRAAFSKIVAGLLQVPLDTLVQRERQRRRRRMVGVVSGLVLLATAAATSAYLVRSAASEADARRRQAASFAGLFVDSLDDRIARYEKVGTLDADLTTALEFFATLLPDEMDPKTLNDYRTALIGIGNVRIRQGKPQSALEVYSRASELSHSIAAREGGEAKHWYDLAVLTYYIGEAHWEMQDFPETAQRIVEALGYAERAAALAPDDFRYQLEVVFDLTNLGATDTRLKRYDAATEALERSLDEIGTLRASNPGHEQDLLEQEVEAISWLAEIAQKRSQYEAAFKWHRREIDLREQLIAATHDNPHHIARLSDALGYYADSLSALATPRARSKC
jgi:tetratricopeptide (TPR) repeat protein